MATVNDEVRQIESDGAPTRYARGWHCLGLARDFADGKPHRVPGKSRFTTPTKQKADLTVEWRERTVNVAIDAKKFTIEVPAGLPACGPKPTK